MASSRVGCALLLRVHCGRTRAAFPPHAKRDVSGPSGPARGLSDTSPTPSSQSDSPWHTYSRNGYPAVLAAIGSIRPIASAFGADEVCVSSVNLDTGDIYPKGPGGTLGDSIGNIHDFLPED